MKKVTFKLFFINPYLGLIVIQFKKIHTSKSISLKNWSLSKHDNVTQHDPLFAC